MTTSARVGVDVGGTFTDVACHDPDGKMRVLKLLSTQPGYERGVVKGIGSVLRGNADIENLSEFVHGTTLATNAVLERRGARTALVTTAGFRDVIELRRLRMPHMYDLLWRKPTALVPRSLRFEVRERMMSDGTVLTPVDEDECRRLATRLKSEAVESVAVAFLHAHLYPEHEELVAEILGEVFPASSISISSGILREQGEYERSATTVVNAYVRPLMSEYLDKIEEGLAREKISAPMMIMQSSGGLMSSEGARQKPVFALESGPAAGVVAALNLATHLTITDAIAFDMGGTTAKASLINAGEVSRGREYEVGGTVSIGSRLIRGSGEVLRIPNIDIAEVGAGGGSIAWIDPAGGLQIGPESAGANPGPACYGLGGNRPTVTDANVVLGFIQSGQIANSDIEISPDLAAASIEGLAAGLDLSVVEAALGIHRLANARMMRALRAVSSERGRDPRELTLIAYGGSGPLHAANLADELGLGSVVVPEAAGLFSALGLLTARPEFHEVRSCTLDARAATTEELEKIYAEMEGELASSAGSQSLVLKPTADLRYKGQSWEVEVAWRGGEISTPMTALIEDFAALHEKLYGVKGEDEAPIEIRALRLAALGREATRPLLGLRSSTTPDSGTTTAYFGGDPLPTPMRTRDSIGEQPTRGPLLVREYDTTVVIPPGWHVRRDLQTNALIASRSDSTDDR